MMQWRSTLIAFLLVGVSTISDLKAHIYYISPSGDDTHNGLSPQTAWKSIAKLNAMPLNAGDKVLFEGGAVFKGAIILNEQDGGNAQKPLILSSFGQGKAIIDAGKNAGILIYNTQGVCLSKLIIQGEGAFQIVAPLLREVTLFKKVSLLLAV